jgi:hypothetical protein
MALIPNGRSLTLIDNLPATLIAGAGAGCAATAPMTAAMELMHRGLPWRERYPLPPSEIVSQLTEAIGLRKYVGRQEHIAITLASHFAYGTAAGALYGPLARIIPLPAALKGVIFGLLVWTLSYLGLLPGLGILRPATKHPPRRNALMIAAHILWGLVLGLLTERLQPQEHAR